MINNPIMRKEVLSALRTKKAVAMQALMLVFVAGLVWLLWPAGGLQDLGGEQARRILSVLAMGELAMVVLFAPAFTAASLTSEAEHNTLESLFATSLRPWEIAVGKMTGSLAFLVLLVLVGTPALAAPLMLGGVRGSDVLATVAILILTAIYVGMIGLLVSSYLHRSYRAIIVTYAVLLVVCLLFALPATPISNRLLERGGPTWQATWHVLASFSPIEAMLSLVMPTSLYAVGARSMPPFWQLYIPISCVVIAITGALCLYKLHRPIAPPRPREKLKVVERGKITARSFLFLIDPRKRKRMIARWQNPVLIKEFRTRPMLQAHWLLRAAGICLIVSVLLMFLVTFSVTAFVAESTGMVAMMGAVVAALMVLVIIVIGPAMTGGTLCADRETGVWDLIRTTRLSSWTIVSGKFYAAIIPLLLLALAMLPALALLMMFGSEFRLVHLLRVAYVVGTTILFVTAAGMFFSGIFDRTSTATAWTYAVILSIGLSALFVLLGREIFSSRLTEAIFVLNPVAAALDAAGSHRMGDYGLVGRHLQIMLAASCIMLVVSVIRVFQLRRVD